MPRRHHPMRAAAVLAGLGLLAMTGCGLQPATSYVPAVAPGSIEPIEGLEEGAALTFVSKNYPEQLILGKIGVLVAQAAGFDVTDMSNVPGSVPVRELMTSGTADMMWEYTGVVWLTHMGEEVGFDDEREQYEAVRDADAENGLTWLEPAALNNTYAIAVRSEAIEELGGVATLSDLAALPVEQRTFCVEPEFNSRADGLGPMLDLYGIPRGDAQGVPDENVMIYDTGAVYTATDRGTCNFGEVFSTDGRIDSLDLTLLEDDLGYFPAYNAAAVINTETFARYPELEGIFESVSETLTDEVLRALNLRVDEGGEQPADVALDFLVQEGFVTAP